MRASEAALFALPLMDAWIDGAQPRTTQVEVTEAIALSAPLSVPPPPSSGMIVPHRKVRMRLRSSVWMTSRTFKMGPGSLMSTIGTLVGRTM